MLEHDAVTEATMQVLEDRWFVEALSVQLVRAALKHHPRPTEVRAVAIDAELRLVRSYLAPRFQPVQLYIQHEVGRDRYSFTVTYRPRGAAHADPDRALAVIVEVPEGGRPLAAVSFRGANLDLYELLGSPHPQFMSAIYSIRPSTVVDAEPVQPTLRLVGPSDD